ncbi:hypothetical protein PILCRDRAFT_667653 [Piloderma croceum F 1598]|uniref:Uncharacterized protein n=1 Tax=Piloderma croceum (strain F 1598) TaxID=765440 RepID=A0A0C3F753_PILCF|nr:hypothetical protein PILCRDRAFT_667653 [Piloderma croceum F 1598]
MDANSSVMPLPSVDRRVSRSMSAGNRLLAPSLTTIKQTQRHHVEFFRFAIIYQIFRGQWSRPACCDRPPHCAEHPDDYPRDIAPEMLLDKPQSDIFQLGKMFMLHFHASR